MTTERAAPGGRDGVRAPGEAGFEGARGEPGQESWPAPAKLNLFLHVLGRRADGYHELQTCFQFVDLCDDIRIAVRADGEIHRSRGAAGVAEESDLCVRAARALKAATGCPLGADIDVEKRIPMGAGLGGGSSDAATCLVALNRLWGLNLPTTALAELGLKLGADVPVFVMGRAAWAEGVGEKLTPLYPPEAPPEGNYLIIKPNVFVSTAEVFQDPELTRKMCIRDSHCGKSISLYCGHDLAFQHCQGVRRTWRHRLYRVRRPCAPIGRERGIASILYRHG